MPSVCAPKGPLVDIYFFDVEMLKHCTLHVLNLGLLGVSNGSALPLGPEPVLVVVHVETAFFPVFRRTACHFALGEPWDSVAPGFKALS